jgi:hypothetical protein
MNNKLFGKSLSQISSYFTFISTMDPLSTKNIIPIVRNITAKNKKNPKIDLNSFKKVNL